MMLIQPSEPIPGHPQQRRPGGGAAAAHDARAIPEGLLRGRVEALLADGQVRVGVAGRMLQFMPPRPMAPGEYIHLRIAAREPQLVLEIADSTGESVADLSSASTLIARLSAPGAPRPGLIAAAQPLLQAAPVDSAGIVPQLARAISDSGLFYESHQAEWSEGRRALSRLAAEPQSLLPRPAPPALLQPETGTYGFDEGRARQSVAGALQAHPETLPLLRSQLDALDSRRILWSGELWPGQPGTWEISNGDDEGRAPADDAAPAASVWRTRICLDLPRLGPVSAVFEARGRHTEIRIEAAHAGTAEILAGQATGLRTALSAAGVAVDGLCVLPAGAAEKATP